MLKIKLAEWNAVRCWLWERLGSADFRYLADIAREERASLDDVALGGASNHPDARRMAERLGATRDEREADFGAFLKEWRRYGLKAVWRPEFADFAAPAGHEAAAFVPEEISPAERVLARALSLMDDGSAAAPPGLFWRGDLSALEPGRKRLGVCGTRAASPFGAAQTDALAKRAAAEGWTCVHGAARGVDAACARGCEEASGFQVLVLSSGLGSPSEEHPLRDMIDAPGVLAVSVRPPFCQPHRGSLIERNRLIAALSEALVVAQTGPRGGSWHTIRAARSMNVPLFSFEREISAKGSGEFSVPNFALLGKVLDNRPAISEEEQSEGRRMLVKAGASLLPSSWVRDCPSDALRRRLFEGDAPDEAAVLFERLSARFGCGAGAFQGSVFDGLMAAAPASGAVTDRAAV